jgi:hypothetical protein
LNTYARVITSPAGGIKTSKRGWRDKQNHAEKVRDAKKINPIPFSN